MDRTDYKMLDILQKRGRISSADLAKEINLSPTPVSYTHLTLPTNREV